MAPLSDALRPPRRPLRPRAARGRAGGRARPARRRADRAHQVDVDARATTSTGRCARRSSRARRRSSRSTARSDAGSSARPRAPPRARAARRDRRRGRRADAQERRLAHEGRARARAATRDRLAARTSVLRRKDFAAMTPGGVRTTRARSIAEIARSARPRRRSRRLRPHHRGPRARPAPARCARRSRTGGDPVERSYRRRLDAPRKRRPARDVSGSMERYARAMLIFLHAAVGAGPRGRGLRVRHAADAAHARARTTRDPDRALEARAGACPTGRAAPGSARVAEGLQRRLGPARPLARRGRRRRLRRLGAPGPRRRSARRWPPARAPRTRSSG